MLRRLLYTAADLLFPRTCKACGAKVTSELPFWCLNCELKLPIIGPYKKNNSTEQILLGRIKIVFAYSWLYYQHRGIAAKLIGHLKYKQQKTLGVYLGERLALALKKNSELYQNAVLLPLPLNPKRLKQRGFNQSRCIAEGIARIWGIPIIDDSVFRLKHTPSQTKKSREERIINMQNAFETVSVEQLKGRRIIIVDDIITTGATLEACGLALQKVPGVEIGILTVAKAHR